MIVVPHADTRSTGHCFLVMAQLAIDKIPSDPKLDALTAEKVFGWKNIQTQKRLGREWSSCGLNSES
jgi:hypothetical protein